MPETNEAHAAARKQAQEAMYAGRFEDALLVLQPVIENADDADDADALYMAAVSARYLKRPDEAAALLKRIKAVAPEFGRAHQEEGHLLRDRGDAAGALTAYRRAVAANPALHAAWAEQAKILDAQGRSGEAAQARAQVERLQRLPKELLAASHHLYENRLLKAENICRAWLQRHPKDVEGMRLLAEIGVRLGVLEDADFLLESAVAFEPDNTAVRIDYVQVLRKRQKHEAALEQAKELYKRDPRNPVFVSQLAIQRMQTGEYEGAVALFDDVLAMVPNDPATLTSKGHALKTWGKHDDAVNAYRAACRARPEHGDAWYGLANLKTYRFTDDEIAEMRRVEAGDELGFQDRIYICFSLGKAYEDREDYESSFRLYERGNQLKRVQTRYTAEQMDEELDAQRTVCTPDLFASQGGKGCPAPDPIFIVGLPRAGSTLLEQILASHSQVDGTAELPNILALAHRLRGRKRASDKARYPQILHELTADQLREFGEDYIEKTRFHRKGAPFFTDKMPNNFRHIGLIKLILPNARIIDARRHPMACCFSGFKQLFAEGQEFTYGLEQIGRYYRGYVDLMRHWDDVLPGAILRVQYEDVVEDLEGQVRRILDYCGLEFEPQCVEFHKTEREVRTASSEQVRQPIYKEGVEQWRHYEPWLDPLKEALGPALEDYRD